MTAKLVLRRVRVDSQVCCYVYLSPGTRLWVFQCSPGMGLVCFLHYEHLFSVYSHNSECVHSSGMHSVQ